MQYVRMFLVRYVLFGGLLFGGLSARTAAQNDARDILIEKLSHVPVALSQLSLESESRRKAHMDLGALFEKWRVGPQIVEARRESYEIDGEKFVLRLMMTDSGGRSPELDQEFKLRSRMSFDGVYLRFGKDDDVSIFPRVALRQRFSESARFCSSDYFESIRIRLPTRAGELGSLPTSMVLESLLRGAKVSKVQGHLGPLWSVQECSDDDVKTVWLDEKVGFAVRRWEVRSAGKVREDVACSDFEPVNGVFLPKLVERRWFSWHTVPEEIADSPMITERTVVTRLDPSVVSGDWKLEVRPGGRVRDARYAAAGGASSGFLDYRAPVDGNHLWREFSNGAGHAAGGAGGLWVWVLLHGAALLCWWLGVRYMESRCSSD